MKIMILTIVAFFSFSFMGFNQTPKFSLEINYGLAGNHFVNSYTEQGEGFIPEGFIYLADKDFLGTVSKIQVNYEFKNETSISVGYARDSHQSERDYLSPSTSRNLVLIKNWSIRHNNNMFFGSHKRHINKTFNYHVGVFVIHPEQQEIDIREGSEHVSVLLDERDLPNNRLAEGGFLAGIDYEKQLDTRFVGGLHLSGFYLASTGTYETTYLTASLAYQFAEKQ